MYVKSIYILQPQWRIQKAKNSADKNTKELRESGKVLDYLSVLDHLQVYGRRTPDYGPGPKLRVFYLPLTLLDQRTFNLVE